jgi:hypothetical protein
LATNETGINSLLVFDVPVEFGWKLWGVPMRIFGNFATNFEAAVNLQMTYAHG